jgi:peptidyl-prolyl cis-trans isomerase B (cyclophilin B)
MTTFGRESRAILKTSMGDVALEFFPDRAPRTCEHFVKLARQGFYDGLTFHRILKGFVIQGGCPKGDGSGGPGFTLRAEFNETPHVKGTVSMARGADPHSAGSQFFICCGEARYLDHRYTAFARVVEGLEVVEKIASVPVTENRWKELSTPREPVFINRIVLEGIEFDAEEPAPQAAAPAQAPRAPQAPPAGAADDGEDGEDEDDGDEPEAGEGLDDDADEPSPEARDEDDEAPVTPPSGAEDEGADGGNGGAAGAPPAAPGQAGRKRGRRRGGRRRRKD